MTHYHHEFAHSVVRGAGWAAGRDLEHALGLWVFVPLIVLALILGATGRKK